MKHDLKIGIIGDFDPIRPSQIKTKDALEQAADQLSITINAVWLPTDSLSGENQDARLSAYDALWAGPGSYANPEGAIDAIKFCREKQWPFIGT